MFSQTYVSFSPRLVVTGSRGPPQSPHALVSRGGCADQVSCMGCARGRARGRLEPEPSATDLEQISLESRRSEPSESREAEATKLLSNRVLLGPWWCETTRYQSWLWGREETWAQHGGRQWGQRHQGENGGSLETTSGWGHHLGLCPAGRLPPSHRSWLCS